MSLWYDLKKKSYATNGKESWIKSYCDRAIELLNQKLSSHFNGAEGRHKAEDVDFEGSSTVKEVVEQGFSECSRKNESLIASLETERSERETECVEIRTQLQNEKAERIADLNEVRTELQNEIQAREEKINGIKEDIAPVLLPDELKVATIDETDSSVLCFRATDNYSAEGLEFSFKAPCSKSEISRIDVTLLDGDMELMSEVEEVEPTDSDVEISDLDIPTDEPIEEPEEPDLAQEKTESFTFKSGKDFKEGEYVTILFSGSTVEVKAVYQAGFYESRISENARDINILYRYDKQNTDDIFDNYENIRLLQDKTDELDNVTAELSDRASIAGADIENVTQKVNAITDGNGRIDGTAIYADQYLYAQEAVIEHPQTLVDGDEVRLLNETDIGQWRLILDTTLEEDAVVSVSQDLDGNALNLKKFKILVSTPQLAEQLPVWLSINNVLAVATDAVAATASNPAFAIWGELTDEWQLANCVSVTGVRNPGAVKICPAGNRYGGGLSTVLTNIKLSHSSSHSTPFAAGSNIKIWGCY